MKTNCIAYYGTNQKPIPLELSDTLAEVRSSLGNFMPAKAEFCYFSPMAQETILISESVEKNYELSKIINSGNTFTISDTTKGNQDLEGNLVSQFQNRGLQVGFELNMYNQDAIKANTGKFEPFLLVDVQKIVGAGTPKADQLFDYAIICEKGTALNICLTSWGNAGFGMKVYTDAVDIFHNMYLPYKTNFGTSVYTEINRYSSQASNIMIDSLADYTIPSISKNIASYSYLKIETWPVNSWSNNTGTYTGHKTMSNEADTTSGNNLTRQPNGKIIPKDGIAYGALKPRGHSTTSFSGPIKVISESKNSLIGKLNIALLVFKTQADANQFVKQNSIPHI